MEADAAVADDDRRDDEVVSDEEGREAGSALQLAQPAPELRLAPWVSEQADLLGQLTSAAEALARYASVKFQLSDSILGLGTAGHLDEAIRGMNGSLAGAAGSNLANLAAVHLRGLDQFTAFSGLYAQHALTARWAESALGFGAVTNWRVALEADSHVEHLLNSVAAVVQPYSSLFTELSRVSRTQASFTDWIVQRDASSHLLGEVSGRPLALWRDYLGGLPPEPALRDVRTSIISGYAGLGFLGADVLTSGAEDIELVKTCTSKIETDVLLPWEESRLKLGRALRDRLGAIDPSVPELLAGAWDDLERNGPAAVEKATHCITEVLDRTLRAAAPDDDVRQWHAGAGRPIADWEGRDRPPYSLRVKFLAQRLGGEQSVVVAQFDSLAVFHKKLRSRLQAGKHASQGDLTTVRNLILCAEDLLGMLFMSAKENE